MPRAHNVDEKLNMPRLFAETMRSLNNNRITITVAYDAMNSVGRQGLWLPHQPRRKKGWQGSVFLGIGIGLKAEFPITTTPCCHFEHSSQMLRFNIL